MSFDIRTYSYFNEAKKKFLSKVDKTDTCWLWTAGKIDGYGQFQIDGQGYQAHRMSYMLFKEPIPYGKIVRHTCDNKTCVNPEHLILGTYADNAEDSVRRNRHGHQKLNEEAVKVIKWELKYQPKYGLATKLAQLYNVSQGTISNIKNGYTWYWVKI